jgi:hypothetical protein
LRKPGNTFLDARHANEHHTGGTLVEYRAHLLETVHLEAIGLIHQD